jgi:hypothetical protein
MGDTCSRHSARSTPIAVWLVFAATAIPVAIDELLGLSTPLLMAGRLALAAGVLRGARGFRVLLRVMSILSMVGAVWFAGAAKGAWAVAGAEFGAALFAVIALGFAPVRAWCPDPPTGPAEDFPSGGDGEAAPSDLRG